MLRLLLEKLILSYLENDEITWLSYCLRALGFLGDATEEKYLLELYKAMKRKYENDYKIVLKNGVETYRGNHEKSFAYMTYNIIKNEMRFKKSGYVPNYIDPSAVKFISNYIAVHTAYSYVTATDISSYTYCPASYCIKKSFVEDEVSEETKVGTELHESNRLLLYTSGEKKEYKLSDNITTGSLVTEENKAFFDDIKDSKILYVGHNKEGKKYFKSSKGSFFGQPDYVFVNDLGKKYIVEEKFRDVKKEIKSIRLNHKLQLASYINGIDELSASYGYLLYWYYSYENKVRRVKKCTVFKVEESVEDKAYLRETYKSILKLSEGSALDFDSNNLDAAKCASCVVRKFCGHKTGRFFEITVPYDKKYYNLVK